MSKVVRAPRKRQAQYIGFSMPLKDMLGVGPSMGDETEEMNRLLDEKAGELKQLIFEKKDPIPEEIDARIEDGTILDFRSQRYMPQYRDRLSGNIYREQYLEDSRLYFRMLAYHYYIKRDVNRIASECGVCLGNNPLSYTLDYPFETLIVPAQKGQKTVDDFLHKVDGHLDSKYGVRLQYPEDIDKDIVRKYSGFKINDPERLMQFPGDWKRSIAGQMPPKTDDVLSVREYFNQWYVDDSQIRERTIDALLKGVETKTSTFHGIKMTSRINPESKVRILKRDRV